jgi:Ubiquitin elongating factor core
MDVLSVIEMQVMDALPNNEFVNVVIVFLGSPAYIKNAHLRAKLIDVRPWSWPSQGVQ